MPVNTNPQGTKLKLQLDGGFNEDGKAVTKSKTYSNVKSTASDDDVYAVATSLVDLQTMPLVSVRKIEEVELTESI